MDAAAKCFVGTKDFASVAGGGEGVPWAAAGERRRGTVRTVLSCGCERIAPGWGPDDGSGVLYEVRVVADGFLPRMVRTMTSVIVDVGRNVMTVDAVDEMLAARDRRLGGGTAPAQGLTLWRVGYTDWTPASVPPA
jgi:tRNA pseudouridine(38-40) synthase